jgi:hypothetical protein
MAGKSIGVEKAPQYDVDMSFAGENAEVADKTHAHWTTQATAKNSGSDTDIFSSHRTALKPAHVLA